MNKLNIIQVITTPSGGGAEVLVRELGLKIADYGYESEVIYFNTNSSGAQNINLNKNEIVLNVNNRSLKSIWKLRKIFKERSRNSQKCIIHTHLTGPFFYVVLATIGLNFKLVFTEHSTTNKRRKIPLFKYIDKFFYKRYEKIICISQGTKESLDGWIGQILAKKTIVVQNGSRIYSFKNREILTDIQNIKFISIGSLNEHKGFDTSIKALSLLKNIDWEYTIIGEGPERINLELLIKELNIENKVKLVGWSDKIEEQLHKSDIQLIPSLWEGFGLVAVEGMSTGLPIVASNVDGLREVLHENNPSVFLVDKYKNENKFHEKILECIKEYKNNSFYMAECSRKQAVKFDMNKMIEKYINIYINIYNIER